MLSEFILKPINSSKWMNSLSEVGSLKACQPQLPKPLFRLGSLRLNLNNLITPSKHAITLTT